MPIEELTDQLATSTTRRTIVKTGAKLAYAAPIVAATMKLSAGGAAAAVSDGGNQACNTFVCGNGPCASRPDIQPFADCFCFEVAETPGQGVCLSNFPCAGTQICTASSECNLGETCVVNTCCGPEGHCTPACPPAGQAQSEDARDVDLSAGSGGGN